MAERTVPLDEEAYERLAARRRDGESFSDVVKRLTGERAWSDVAGIMDDQTDEIEAAIEEGRERSRERRNRLRPEEEESDDVVSNPDR